MYGQNTCTTSGIQTLYTGVIHLYKPYYLSGWTPPLFAFACIVGLPAVPWEIVKPDDLSAEIEQFPSKSHHGIN